MRRFVTTLTLCVIMIVTSVSFSLADNSGMCLIQANKPVFTTLDAAKLAERLVMSYPKSEWEPIAREMGRQGTLRKHDKPMPAVILSRPSTGYGWFQVKILSPVVMTVYVWCEHITYTNVDANDKKER